MYKKTLLCLMLVSGSAICIRPALQSLAEQHRKAIQCQAYDPNNIALREEAERLQREIAQV